MRKWLFIALMLSIVATIVLTAVLPEGERRWIYVSGGLSLVVSLLLLRSVILPGERVARGMELLRAQDFNNRLTNVGQYDADRIVGLFNSMIDRLRNERLRNLEQESFLKLLIDASPMGVVMLDFDGHISMVNSSFLRITGLPAGIDMIGKRVNQLGSELAAKMEDVELGTNTVLRTGDVMMYRCYHLSFIQTGFRRRFYLLESLTEEVMKAERNAYEKVIRIISHEVNNTMGGVRSVLETIGMVSEDEDIREVVESCDDRCDKMCRFVSSYADVVRVPDPVKTSVDLNVELEKMVPFLQQMTREGIALIAELPDDEVMASIDVSLMEQVIVNIVKNACESIDGDGWVRISTSLKENGKPVLEISNNGRQITEEESAQLFRPFFTTKRDGKGIGLTLISEILKKHGATFTLRTTSDGITRFRICFQ